MANRATPKCPDGASDVAFLTMRRVRTVERMSPGGETELVSSTEIPPMYILPRGWNSQLAPVGQNRPPPVLQRAAGVPAEKNGSLSAAERAALASQATLRSAGPSGTDATSPLNDCAPSSAVGFNGQPSQANAKVCAPGANTMSDGTTQPVANATSGPGRSSVTPNPKPSTHPGTSANLYNLPIRCVKTNLGIDAYIRTAAANIATTSLGLSTAPGTTGGNTPARLASAGQPGGKPSQLGPNTAPSKHQVSLIDVDEEPATQAKSTTQPQPGFLHQVNLIDVDDEPVTQARPTTQPPPGYLEAMEPPGNPPLRARPRTGGPIDGRSIEDQMSRDDKSTIRPAPGTMQPSGRRELETGPIERGSDFSLHRTSGPESGQASRIGSGSDQHGTAPPLLGQIVRVGSGSGSRLLQWTQDLQTRGNQIKIGDEWFDWTMNLMPSTSVPQPQGRPRLTADTGTPRAQGDIRMTTDTGNSQAPSYPGAAYGSTRDHRDNRTDHNQGYYSRQDSRSGQDFRERRESRNRQDFRHRRESRNRQDFRERQDSRSRQDYRRRQDSRGTQGPGRYGATALVPYGAASTPYGAAPMPYESAPREPVSTMPDWVNWPQLAIKISRLPRQVELSDIHKAFKPHGTVTCVSAFADGAGRATGDARVIYMPPPSGFFWNKFSIDIAYTNWRGEEDSVSCRITMEKVRESIVDNMMIPSPVDPGQSWPAYTTLLPELIQFGEMVGPAEMIAGKNISAAPVGPHGEPGLKVEVNLRTKSIVITFPVWHGKDKGNSIETMYRFRVLFSGIRRFRRSALLNRSVGAWALVMDLATPPIYQQEPRKMEPTFVKGQMLWNSKGSATRVIRILDDPSILARRPVEIRPEYVEDKNFIDLGLWTTIRLVFPYAANGHDVIRSLEDFSIHTEDVPDINMRVPWTPVPIGPSPFGRPVAAGSRSYVNTLQELTHLDGTVPPELDFPVRYMLEACISHRFICEHRITQEFMTRLIEMEPRRARIALERVWDDGIGRTGYYDPFDPMSLFRRIDREVGYIVAVRPVQLRGRPKPGFAIFRKATVTPTTIYLGAPTIEPDNRILRQYSEVADRFLRVQFVEEDLHHKMGPAIDKENTSIEVYTRPKQALENGILLGGRKYQFLAYGNSQIREAGAYFFASDGKITCDSIREWMGFLSHIRNPAKHASRMGQCLSTTRPVKPLTIPTQATIKDVVSNGYCFTDGVGIVSSYMMEVISDDLYLARGIGTMTRPSAVQFRMGGSKGVLVVWSGYCSVAAIQLRPSQIKFRAQSNAMEIIRCSRTSVATLNRQTITVLLSLGVPSGVFTKMAAEQLEDYDGAMTDMSLAAKLLRTHVDGNHQTLTLSYLLRHGFIDHRTNLREPWVDTMLRLWRAWSLRMLKDKARLVVEKGAFVLGVVDESDRLRGHSFNEPMILPQIFIQVPDPKADRFGDYVVITGNCLVGRNPSLHPGDIRLVQAVDIPELRHLHDVVVFPRRGDRDIPSMCSGGDLDGDDFFVIWDERLVQPVRGNRPPMNEQPSSGRELGRDVTTKDITDFFVEYMQCDSLGPVAMAHLANADLQKDGLHDHRCIELAQIHSRAVDYVKSGEPATLPNRLRPSKWPHFMGRDRNSYHSGTALGQIYDQVIPVNFKPSYTGFDPRILDSCKPGGEVMEQAKILKGRYDRDLLRLMAQRGIKTEFEFCSGFAVSGTHIGSGYKLSEDLGNEISALNGRYQDRCRVLVGSDGDEFLAPLVVAVYQLTAEEMGRAVTRRNDAQLQGVGEEDLPQMPIMGFAWIFPRVLAGIAAKKYDLEAEPLHFGQGKRVSEDDDDFGMDPEVVDEFDVGRYLLLGDNDQLEHDINRKYNEIKSRVPVDVKQEVKTEESSSEEGSSDEEEEPQEGVPASKIVGMLS